jgi:hypothetical protein
MRLKNLNSNGGLAVKARTSLTGLRSKVGKRTPIKQGDFHYLETLFDDFGIVVKPRCDGMNVTEWVAENNGLIDALLTEHKAVLIRGFELHNPTDFERSSSYLGNLCNYVNRSTQRSTVQGQVYTSTDYPPSEQIPLHNENSYSNKWPLKILFYCHTPSLVDGCTPIGRIQRLLDLIDPLIVERFSKLGVMYVRNYANRLDLNWDEAFQTDEKSKVEEYCSNNNIQYTWRANGSLRTTQICPALRRHARTDELLWFNQANLFHYSALRDVGQQLVEALGEENLPRNAYYGNGQPIEESIIQEISSAYTAIEEKFTWEKGDLLVLDNMYIAHGRESYSGDRKVMVTMLDEHQAPISISNQ